MSKFNDAEQLYQKAIINEITDSDLDLIINWPQNQLSLLFASSDQVRQHFFKNTVSPCSIMNIKSGGCSEDCAFCSQSSHNHTTVDVRPLAKADEIREQAHKAAQNNLPLSLVSSGRKLSTSQIASISEAIKDCDVEKHASLGILTDEELKMLIDAGVVCYHHNLETARSFFPSICTTHTYDERVETVKKAKKAGFKICCGGILGLGESWEQRKEFCMELKSLDVNYIPLNFLNAIPGTRVQPPSETALDFLRIIAMFRLALPNKTIKICGGREVQLGPLQSMMFYAGANGFITGGYLTTPGAGIDADNKLIEALGLTRTK